MNWSLPGITLCGKCRTAYHGSRTVVIDKSGNTCSGSSDGTIRTLYWKPLINFPIDYRS